MNLMNKKQFTDKKAEDFTIKDALIMDRGEFLFRSHVIIDPAPMPRIPLTPIIIGSKIVY